MEGGDEMAEEVKEVLTAEDLAEYLGFSKNWVYRKAEAGEIPGVKLGKRWRFKRSIVDKWLEERIGVEGRAKAGVRAEAKARAEVEKLPPETAELKERVLGVIEARPEGVTLPEIGEALGLGWRGLTSYIRRLIDEGKVRKEGREYFPVGR